MFGGKNRMMDHDPVVAKALQDVPDDMGGQEDNVHAMVSEGEYIIPADVVAALGDGNTEAGAQKLDMLVQNIREHKMANGSNMPPPAKGMDEYMQEPLPDLDDDSM
jgi:hypothetical protein